MRTQSLTTNRWSWWWVNTRQERRHLSGKNQNINAFKNCRFVHVFCRIYWCVGGNNVVIGDLDFRYLIEQDFPGSRVGPEPTTDCFTAVMYGDVEGIIPGNALTMDPKKPFRHLDPFGNAFLNRWYCMNQQTEREGKQQRGGGEDVPPFFFFYLGTFE